jgi:hypothetical protein
MLAVHRAFINAHEQMQALKEKMARPPQQESLPIQNLEEKLNSVIDELKKGLNDKI